MIFTRSLDKRGIGLLHADSPPHLVESKLWKAPYPLSFSCLEFKSVKSHIMICLVFCFKRLHVL